MTDDEICGYETVNGGECQNRAGDNGRCWIPQHNPDSDKGTDGRGRPTKFNDKRARKAIEAAKKGKSESGCERAAGVTRGTINNWLDKGFTFEDESGKERDFFTAFAHARAQGEDQWIREGRSPEGDSSFAKFMLNTSYDYKETEKREVEHSDDSDTDGIDLRYPDE